MGGSSKRGPNELAERAQALKKAAEAMPCAESFGAAHEEVERARRQMLKRVDALWAESGKRYLLKKDHP